MSSRFVQVVCFFIGHAWIGDVDALLKGSLENRCVRCGKRESFGRLEDQ